VDRHEPSGSLTVLQQKIEGVRRLANKTITLSFWAIATAPINVGANLSQEFGFGGSPSTHVFAPATAPVVAVGTTWARHTVTIAMPSIAGKTFGTTVGTDCNILNLWLSCPSADTTYYAASGNLGVQSAGITLWGMQLEVNSSATALEKPDPRYDLANCQRFYYAVPGPVSEAGMGWGSGAYLLATVTFPVTMRAVPTVLYAASGETNVSATAVNFATQNFVTLQATTTVATGNPIGCTFGGISISADL
jgi:hypothetical protein